MPLSFFETCYSVYMFKNLVHFSILTAAVVLATGFAQAVSLTYAVALIGLLLIWYMVVKQALVKIHRHDPPRKASYLLESVVSTFVLQLAVMVTGGMSSPLFFLLLLHIVALTFFLPTFVVAGLSILSILVFFATTPGLSVYAQIFLFIQFEVSLLAAFFIKDLYRQTIKEPATTIKEQAQVIKDDTTYFLLLAKNHVVQIAQAADEFAGDHHLKVIQSAANELEKLFQSIEKKR